MRAFLEVFPFEGSHGREAPRAAAAEFAVEQGGVSGGTVDRRAGRFVQRRDAVQVVEMVVRAQDGAQRELAFLEQGEDFAEATVQIAARIDGDGVGTVDDDVTVGFQRPERKRFDGHGYSLYGQTILKRGAPSRLGGVPEQAGCGC